MIFLCTGTPNTLLPRLHLAGTPLRSFYREDLPMDFDLFVPLPVARDADGRRRAEVAQNTNQALLIHLHLTAASIPARL